MSLTQNRAVHAAGGFLLMGGWAAFANRSHDMPAPLIAGAVQGALTAGITLVLKAMIEVISRRTSGWARIVLPTFCACAVSVVVLTTIHTLARTPAIAATVAVPITVSTVYAYFYSLSLARHD